MADIPEDIEAFDLLETFNDLAEQQKAIELLRRKLIAAKCKNCQRFGIALKQVRKRNGVSQHSLALTVGYQHASKVNKWERSKEFPRRDELARIISVLHCRREEATLLAIAWWCDPLRPGNYY